MESKNEKMENESTKRVIALLSLEQLQHTPSRRDGVEYNVERFTRAYGCILMQEVVKRMKVSQFVYIRSCVLFHRFFQKVSFVHFDVRIASCACLLLALKLQDVEYDVYRLIIRFFETIEFSKPPCREEEGEEEEEEEDDKDKEKELTRDQLKLITPQRLLELREEVVNTERCLLRELGFILQVDSPHRFLLFYLHSIGASTEDPELTQISISLGNDVIKTNLCLRYPPNVLACGCIYVASKRRFGTEFVKSQLPENWYEVFDAKLEELIEIEKTITYLSQNTKRIKYIRYGKKKEYFKL